MSSIAQRSGLRFQSEDDQVTLGLEDALQQDYIASLEMLLTQHDMADLMYTAAGLEGVVKDYDTRVSTESLDDTSMIGVVEQTQFALRPINYSLEALGLESEVSLEAGDGFMSKIKKVITTIWEAIKKAIHIVYDNARKLYQKTLGNVGQLERYHKVVERKLKTADDAQFAGQYTLQKKGELLILDTISPQAIDNGIGNHYRATKAVVEELIPQVKNIFVVTGVSNALRHSEITEEELDRIDKKFKDAEESADKALMKADVDEVDLFGGYLLSMKASGYSVSRVNTKGDDMGGESIQRFTRDVAESTLKTTTDLIELLDKKAIGATRELTEAQDAALKDLDVLIDQLNSEAFTDEMANKYVRPWISRFQKQNLWAFNELLRLDTRATYHVLRAVEASLDA